jgi:hypothetical protein
MRRRRGGPRRARRHGIDVREAVLVRSGRWRSYDCDDWSCCPPGGSAVPAVDGALAAMTVASGRAVLADRSALVRSVAPVSGRGPAG